MDEKNIPKGWFYPSGLFVNLNWSINVPEKDYLPYLAAFGHEQFHYLQHVGTSFGIFLADVEDLWTTEITKSVNYGLEHSKLSRLPIETWIEVEDNSTVKKKLSEALEFYKKCSRIIEIAQFGGSVSSLQEFITLYQQILDNQANSSNPKWHVDGELAPVKFDGDFPLEGIFGSHLIMESSATYWQLKLGGDVNEIPDEIVELPENIQKGLTNKEGHDAALLRKHAQLSVGDFLEPYRLIGGGLPEDPHEAMTILLIILDLALMPPIGRYNSLAMIPPTLADLFPSIRLLQAGEAVRRLGIRASDIIKDYSKVVNAICTDLEITWPQPEWLAIKTPFLSRTWNDPDDNEALTSLQLQAARYRCKGPGTFAFPRAPLIDDMRIPAVYYTDGIKTGVSKEQSIELGVRFYRKLCAETWITGKKPVIPEIIGVYDGFSKAFNEEFGPFFKE